MLLLQTSSSTTAPGYLCLLPSWAVDPSSREAFPSSHISPGQAKPIPSVRTPSFTKQDTGKGMELQNVQYLGLQRNHFGFALKALCCCTAHVCPWAAVSSLQSPARGADHTLGVSQERRAPPVGFSHCSHLISTFCVVSSLSEHGTHSVVKAVIENKPKF